MHITIVGAGYVGLVTGSCLAEHGHQIAWVDINDHKIAELRAGRLPIFEPDLEPIFERGYRAGHFSFASSLKEKVPLSDVVVLALPTPSDEQGAADLSAIQQVASQLGPCLKSYTVIVIKSTVPVGTADMVYEEVLQGASTPFDVVSNPEFLREGIAVRDFQHPDRVIIGLNSERAQAVMRQLYAPFVDDEHPLLEMDHRSAELTKYAANSFLATKVSFMNEMANLAERVGADIDLVRRGMAPDPRIGKGFLYAGIGYGGSCFPKDVQALLHIAHEHQYDFHILESVATTNQLQRQRLFDRLKRYFQGKIKNKVFGVWGLAFKPDTDDVREAPAIFNITELRGRGASLKLYDPEAMENARKALGSENITYCDSMYEAVHGVDALLIFTEWEAFKNPDFERMKKMMRNNAIFDGRNLFDVAQMEALGFYYASIGRRTASRIKMQPLRS